MTQQQLSRAALALVLEAEDVERLSFSRLRKLYRGEESLAQFKPDGLCQVDPRNGDHIVYNSARASRPHDNRPGSEEPNREPAERECVVCRGKTTGVIDVADLSEGFTFINKNLFPAFYPADSGPRLQKTSQEQPGPEGMAAHGFHFLQWTSSLHDKDWFNMPQPDRIVVLQRLAVLEKKLLNGGEGEYAGFVSIIKNYGRLVGGSLVHGHQQIGLSNVMPRRVQDHITFQQQHNHPFSAYILRTNPANLLIKDYGPAILLTPYFMRRPFDMMLVLKDVTKQYLHQLTADEITAIAGGWHDALRAIMGIMPSLGREIAYNVVTHNGPGAGLYFEFLPYTQEIGGFEQLGLYICQGNPQASAAQIREFLEP